MAQLIAEDSSASSVRPIPAHTQLLAVAWLRWRIFVNNFVRRQAGKRGIVGLSVTILLRIVVWSICALLAIGPVAGCGFLAYSAIANHHPRSLMPLLAGIFALWQFVTFMGLGVAANVSSFNPSSLARFPLRFGRYLVLRMFLGLLTFSNIIGSLVLLAVAFAIGLADHALALPALVVLTVYAWMNVFFNRMLALWLERWLAIRRFRDLFGVLITLFSVGVQFLSFQSRRSQHPSPTANWFLNFLNGSDPFLHWLPPGFAVNAILPLGHPLAQLAQFAALLASTALFLALFAMRLHKQFLAEYLTDAPPRATPAARSRRFARPSTAAPLAPLVSPVIAACLRKEWFDLGGFGTQIINLLTPLLFVLLLGKGIFDQHPAFFLPAAIAYGILGPLSRLYNIFGPDGSGVQLYLLAPIRLRDVVLAKNLVSVMLILLEALLAWVLVLAIVRTSIPLPTHLSAALWLVLVIAANLTMGTLISIQFPRKPLPAPRRNPANRSPTLPVLAVLLGCLILQIPVTLLSRSLGLPWLAVLIFAPLAAAAITTYAVLLRRADQLILNHRDLLAEELCRT